MARRMIPTHIPPALVFGVLAISAHVHAGGPVPNGHADVYLIVGDSQVTRLAFEQHIATAARQKFYHGKPAEADLTAFRAEQTDLLINQELLAQEATRLGIEADGDEVSARLKALTGRYRNTARWQTEGEAMTAAIRQQLERASVIRQLEQEIRQTSPPAEPVLHRWYDDNPQYFTEPVREHVGMILLSVEPSAPAEVWEAARTEAAALSEQLAQGADFAELARIHSSDDSAESGGDMGYLHKGMLGEAAQRALDPLSVGEVSAPVTLLEGIALFRMIDRLPSRLQTFEAVRERASALWQREQSEQQWLAEIERLRHNSRIEVRDH